MVGEGIIDTGYRGPLYVYARNITSQRVRVERGERLAQLILAPIITAEFVVVGELADSPRGSNGFGSTGSSSWTR
jgi:dUTP pyrophosphatase